MRLKSSTVLFLVMSVAGYALATSINSCVSPLEIARHECPSHILDMNRPNSLESVSNCTVINGNLVITGLSNTQCGSGGLSLPNLLEVLGSVTIEHSSCSHDLSHFLPNLIAIHGLLPYTIPVSSGSRPNIPSFALLIHHTALSGIGLRCLRVLGKHGVLLIDDPQMCYADTVGWHLLVPSLPPTMLSLSPNSTISDQNDGIWGRDLLRKEGLFDLCANACPASCEWVTVNNLPRSFCWSQDYCQDVCAAKCRETSLSCRVHNRSECCHRNCIGGCTGPTASDCLVCRNFFHNNTCISSCPEGLYELYGRYCVTREACLSKSIPRDIFPCLMPDRRQQQFPTNQLRGGCSVTTFSVQGRKCLPVCDHGYRRSSSGECLPCGGDCEEVKKDCGDIVIYQQADLASVRDCVSAQSVLISIRTGQDDLSAMLAESFSSLREVYRSLRVIRSDALLSLSFLRHLRSIHGTSATTVSNTSAEPNAASGVTALEITWNANLEDLWFMAPGSTEKLVVLAGSVEFSANNRLCADKIRAFLSDRVAFASGRKLTPSEIDLINTSNGEYALCNAKTLNVTVVEEFQNSVTLRMKPMVWNDPRQILPAIISYSRSENRIWDSDIQDHTFCDSAWNEVELKCGPPQSVPSASQTGTRSGSQTLSTSSSSSPRSGGGGGATGGGSKVLGGEEVLTCQLENLMPATSYAAFITIATLSKNDGAQSRRFHFTTKPATPSSPTFLRAVSAGPSSIQLFWNPPNQPNGKIVEYRIRYLQMRLEKKDFMLRDACYSISFLTPTTSTAADLHPKGSLSKGLEEAAGASEEEVEEDDEGGSDMPLSGESCENLIGPLAASSASAAKGIKRSELLAEELQRREMFLFEDELHKIILIPRVYLEFESDVGADGVHYPPLSADEDKEMHRFYDYAYRDDYPQGYTYSLARSRRDTGSISGSGASSAITSQKTIRVPVNAETVSKAQDASGGGDGNDPTGSSSKLTFLVTGLEHYTEYLFLISACHEPHDEYGNPLPCVGEDCDPDQDAGCSQAVRISERTQAIPHADEVPSDSLFALAPLPPTTATIGASSASATGDNLHNVSDPPLPLNVSQQQIKGETSETVSSAVRPVKLFWNEPPTPNGLILYYWLQYRRTLEGAITTTNTGINSDSEDANAVSSVPWFAICVTPKYLEEEDEATRLLVGARCAVSAGGGGGGGGGGNGFMRARRGAAAGCSTGARTVYTELGFLRAGFYEWQVMAVSLAGNGSWSQSHFFEVRVQSSLHPTHIVAILMVTLVVVGLVAGLLIWCDCRNRKRRMNALANRRSEYLESLLMENFQDEWEVDPKDLTYNLENVLGQGSFGLVCRGRLTRLTTPAAHRLHLSPAAAEADAASEAAVAAGERGGAAGGSSSRLVRWAAYHLLLRRWRRGSAAGNESLGMDVAVKILSPGSTYENVREFLAEASHMKQFNCNHIVRLLGIVSKQVLLRKEPIVVMELMQHGDLATYLRHRMSQEDYSQGYVAPENALKWAAEIADGMAYLAHLGFVHRDLAARNCLVGAALTVKIGDFGLTRDVSNQLYYRKEGKARLPVRWMAPEALTEAYFTFKSDVWSYGVVLWEIATFAALPFPGLSHDEVMNLVKKGGHLGKQGWPPKFPDILLHVMRECWHHEPEYRPSFGEIIMMLEPYVCDAFRTSSFYLNQSPSAREPTEPSPAAAGGARRRPAKEAEGEDSGQTRLLPDEEDVAVVVV